MVSMGKYTLDQVPVLRNVKGKRDLGILRNLSLFTDSYLEQDISARAEHFRKWLSSSANVSDGEREKLLALQNLSSPSWVFEHPTFKEWLMNPKNIIWLAAPAGFGKSVLSAYLTVALKERFPGTPVTFFFCKDKSDLTEVHQIVRTLLFQLAEDSDHVARCTRKIWDSEYSIADLTANNRHYFQKLLIPVLQSYHSISSDSIFMIIDGLNELPKDCLDGVLDLIKAIKSLNDQNDSPLVRLVVTSQRTPSINDALKDALCVSLTSKDNLENVEIFVKKNLSEALAHQFSEAGVDPILYFRQKYRGMFLWVKTILDLLRNLIFDDDLRAILENPPQKINEVYQKVLERLYHDLDEYELPWISEIILWTVMSKRDLTLSEIEVAIVLSRGKYARATKSKVLNIEATLNKCGSILQIVGRGSTTTEKIVTLLHDTFKQFITSENGPSGRARAFLIPPVDANCKIATACISYLSLEFIEFKKGVIIPDLRRRELNRRYPMFSYATMYWSEHYTGMTNEKAPAPEAQEKLAASLCQLLAHENLRNWLNSVMAFSVQGSLYDPVSLSVSSSLSGAIRCIVADPDMSKLVSSGFPNSSTASRQIESQSLPLESRLKKWCATVAAEAWVTVDPVFWGAAVRFFSLARELFFDRPGNDRHISGRVFAQEVEVITELVKETSDKTHYLSFMSQSTAHLYNGGLESLSLAAQGFEAALKVASEKDFPLVCHRLSNCFRNIFWITCDMDDIRKSIKYAEDAVAAACPEDPDYPDYLDLLAECLLLRSQTKAAEQDGGSEDCHRAIQIGRKALVMALSIDGQLKAPSHEQSNQSNEEGISSPSVATANILSRVQEITVEPMSLNPSIFSILRTMGLALRGKAITFDDDLKELIKMCKKALSCMSEQNPDRWNSLGNAFFSCYLASKSIANANKNIVAREEAYNSSTQATQQVNSTDAPIEHEHETVLDDLNEAIFCYRKALALASKGHPDLSMHLNDLAYALLHRKATDDLAEAIEYFRKAIDLAPEEWRAAYLIGLGRALKDRGAGNGIEEAIATYRKAVNLSNIEPSNLSLCATELGNIMYHRGTPADLCEAIECYRIAFKTLPENSPLLPEYANNLANALANRGSAVDNDLNEAVYYYQKAVDLAPEGHIHLHTYLGNLGDQLHERQSTPTDLDDAIHNYRKALSLISDGHIDIPDRADALGAALVERSAPGDLNEAIDCHRKAIAATPEGHVKLHISMHNLGNALYQRKEPGDLDEAIECYRRTVALTEINHVLLPMYVNDLGNALWRRRQHDDIEEAVLCYRRAINLETDNHIDLAIYTNNLGRALQELEGDGNANDSEIVNMLAMSVQLTPDNHRELPRRLYDLGTSLYNRQKSEYDYEAPLNWLPPGLWLSDYDLNGIRYCLQDMFSQSSSVDDITQAVDCVRKSIALKQPTNGYSLRDHKVLLAVCLVSRYAQTESICYLNEAGDLLREILHPDPTEDGLFNLGVFGALALKRFSVTRDIKELNEWNVLVREVGPLYEYRSQHDDKYMRVIETLRVSIPNILDVVGGAMI